jgi:hypothetical protein
MGVRRLGCSLISLAALATTSIVVDGEPSLNVGTRAIHFSWKPRAGMKPDGEGCMQIVPPVMMIKTRDSCTASSGFASPISGIVGTVILLIPAESILVSVLFELDSSIVWFYFQFNPIQ